MLTTSLRRVNRQAAITWGGLYWDGAGGLARSCPLSPLLGAFYLHALDTALAQTDLFYVRYLDDVLVLAPTRRRLRQAVRVLNRELATLGLEKHPDKTFIGKIARGFDFLGDHLTPAGVTVARATVERFAARVTRLYEHERGANGPALGSYVRRWAGWANGGLAGCPLDVSAAPTTASDAESRAA